MKPTCQVHHSILLFQHAQVHLAGRFTLPPSYISQINKEHSNEQKDYFILPVTDRSPYHRLVATVPENRKWRQNKLAVHGCRRAILFAAISSHYKTTVRRIGKE
jgi:hypothetical protein